MLHPDERCVRGKLQLFLRLWVARQKYEGLRPFGDTSAQRIRFHLNQLRAVWDHIIDFQGALGLEVMHFTPNDKFELVYVISAFVERELVQPNNTIIDLPGRWSAYRKALQKLGHQLNPYDFSDACSRCHKIIVDIVTPAATEEPGEVISLYQKSPHLSGTEFLKMKDPTLTGESDEQCDDQSDSGLSRYSPGGRFSYSRK